MNPYDPQFDPRRRAAIERINIAFRAMRETDDPKKRREHLETIEKARVELKRLAPIGWMRQ